MSYEIKTYQDGFIKDQFKIGSKIYDPWPMGGQTRPEQLEKAYNADDFDPETRFYAFDGDEMVGFLTSAFKEEQDGKNYYFFEFPYVKTEHRPEAEVALLDHAISALKEKGADILVARAGEYWGKSLHYANNYEFTKTQDIARRGEIDLNQVEVDDFGDVSDLVSYQSDRHLDQLSSIYAEKYNVPEEQMKQQLSRWTADSVGKEITTPWDRNMTILCHKIAERDDEIIGRVVGMNHENFGEDTINAMQMFVKPGSESRIGDLMAELVRAGQKHNKTTLIIHTGLWGVAPDDTNFKPYDIDFDMKLAYFEKEL